ncbi:MAG: hypothetical protein ACREON_06565 [Gemmatimonadaceae bacterium]
MLRWIVGRAEPLPPPVLARYPELAEARFRRGGLPVRVGGWALGQPSVAAITLWRTIFLAPGTTLDPELLLHELRHVHQFHTSLSFPVRYLLESVVRGYRQNRFEVDARAYARQRLGADPPATRRGDR